MLAVKVVKPSQTESATPLVFALKKDESVRFYDGHRRLHAVTVRDSYPLPQMDECTDPFGDATDFSTTEANSGYWKTELEEVDRDEIAFISHHGQYLFTSMSFGLRKAPGMLQ